MEPFNHRSPGLAGLISSPQKPYYSMIADGIHLHPAVVSMAFRANPERCILITDSVEMAGKPDGVYPGHAQVPHVQKKVGNKVTIDGTDTLIGSCIGLDECVRNLVSYSGCSLAEAIRCVTEVRIAFCPVDTSVLWLSHLEYRQSHGIIRQRCSGTGAQGRPRDA